MFDQEEHSGRTFAVGVLLGALIGAGVALLFAPQSGEETRRLIRRRSRKLASAAHDKVDDFRDSVKKIRKRAEEAIAD